MSDPRKPVHRPDTQGQTAVLDTVHQVLIGATKVGAEAIGATGASFVVIGIGVWAAELADLDARAAARYLRALADTFDPRTNDAQKRRAEKDRSQAVHVLYAAVDLTMAEAAGHG